MSRSVYVQTGEDRRPRQLEISIPEGFSAQAAVPRNYVRAILGQEELHVETAVAINESKVLDAAHRSAATGCEIEL